MVSACLPACLPALNHATLIARTPSILPLPAPRYIIYSPFHPFVYLTLPACCPSPILTALTHPNLLFLFQCSIYPPSYPMYLSHLYLFRLHTITHPSFSLKCMEPFHGLSN